MKDEIKKCLVPPETFGKMIEHLSRFVAVDTGIREVDLEKEMYLEIPVFNDDPVSYSAINDGDFSKVFESRTYRRDFYVKKPIVIFGKTFFWVE